MLAHCQHLTEISHMKSSILIRIAFVLILLHILGHGMGHFTWRDTPDSGLTEIITKMDSYSFDFMGKPQTIGGHHDGFSIIFEITLVFFAGALWYISGKISSAAELRPVLLMVSICLILFGIVELIYFFPLAAGMSMLAGMLAIVAWIKESRTVRQ